MHPQTSGQSTTVVRLLFVVIVVCKQSPFFDVSAGEHCITWLAGFSLGVVGVNAIYILCRLMFHRGDTFYFLSRGNGGKYGLSGVNFSQGKLLRRLPLWNGKADKGDGQAGNMLGICY